MESRVILQQLLLPCKKNCKFDLLTDNPSSPTQYYIYLGVVLVDSIPNNKNHFLYKLMCARLALAGFKLEGLAETFQYSCKTISRWAKILNAGDAQGIADAFGFGHRGKITPEIQSYIKNRYLYLLKTGEHAYSKKILSEVKEYFDLTVTGSGIRPYFREADAEIENEDKSENKNKERGDNEIRSGKNAQEMKTDKSDEKESGNNIKPEENTLETLYSTVEKENVTCAKEVFFEVVARKSGSDFSIAGSGSSSALSSFPPARRQDGDSDKNLPVSNLRPPYVESFFHHVGLILLLPCIDVLTSGLAEGESLCRQLLSQFLLGASNLEQGKTISKDFLKLVLGTAKSHIQGLRYAVYDFASLDFRLKLVARNWEMIKTELSSLKIFYYDPHSKKYTGFKKILMGWCGSLHETTKVLISDYIHTVDGHPCFVEHYDNLYDLRMRFFFTTVLFKKIFPETERSEFTWIIDRGIYGLDTLQKIVDSRDHVITWEKDYKRDGWSDNRPVETLILRMPRNNSRDLKTYVCHYQVDTWKKNGRFKRIIVRITNPSGNTIEVSILSSNLKLSECDIITYMLRRWLQENDFAYLIRLYGIDQLDSYKSRDYKELEGEEKHRDFLTKSRLFKELQKRKLKLRSSHKKALEKREKKFDSFIAANKKKFDQRLEKENSMFLEIMRKTKEGGDEKEIKLQERRLGRMCAKTAEMKKTAEEKKCELEVELNSEIEALKDKISEVELELEEVPKEESRMQAVIEGKYLRLDTASKSVLDILRIMARNSSYELLKDFRPIYDNYRDDHVILRAITRAPGKIQAVNDRLIVELLPQGDFPKATVDKIKLFLCLIEEKINRHFQGQSIPITIKMTFPKNGSSTCAKF